LLLEHDSFIACALDEDFRALGAAIVSVGTCREAMIVLESSLIDIAILDSNVAGVESTSVAAACERRGVPYIITSGNAEKKGHFVRAKFCKNKPYIFTIIRLVGKTVH